MGYRQPEKIMSNKFFEQGVSPGSIYDEKSEQSVETDVAHKRWVATKLIVEGLLSRNEKKIDSGIDSLRECIDNKSNGYEEQLIRCIGQMCCYPESYGCYL